MANWKLKINIKEEMQALKKFCQDFSQTYEFEGENEAKYMELCKNLAKKFSTYKDKIIELTEDDGTWEDLENNLLDLEMSLDLENSNYNMENIYEICDVAEIWLVQR